NELHEAVTLDGSVTDFAWERTNGLTVDTFFSDGGANVPPVDQLDYSGAFHTGWYDGMLYMAVIVDDDDVRNIVEDGNRDSVEVYLDGDNSDSEGVGWPTNYDEVDDFQLIFALNADNSAGADITGAWFGNPTGNPDGYKGPKGANEGQDFEGIDWSVSMTETGYILEIALDMAVVPGLDTFVNEGLMGMDVAIVDNDGTGEMDEEDNEIVEKTHAFFCDDANWNWNGTAHFGTAYVAPAMPAVAMFGDGNTDVIGLEGEASSGDATYEVATNFTDVAYAIEAEEDWLTIDFDPMVGAGETEFSWAENTGLYERTSRIQFTDANGLNRIDVTQGGIAPQAMAALFPEATAGEMEGMAMGYMGGFYYGDFPWLYTSPMQWIYGMEESLWMYSGGVNDYFHTSGSMWPMVYFYGSGSVTAGWKYLFYVEGVGSYLYDYSTNQYSENVVFPE
ncbi:MAG: hypothetical protein GVY10_08730, partial [Verrucomicrobia bacterium]|nr:hypothetical protein [Verrucomicrobiota bacterium]